MLQRLIKMSFWNINILFRTKTFSSQLRVSRAGPGILKCETIDPWKASEPESEANIAVCLELSCEECMQQMWSGLWIQGFKYPDQDEMCVWHELTTNAAFILDWRNIFIVECCINVMTGSIFLICVNFWKLVKFG